MSRYAALAFLPLATVVSLNRATRLAPRSREPDRLGVADEVDLVLVGVDLARVRLCVDFVAFDLDCVRADEDLVALFVRIVLVRLRACAGLAGFLPGVDLADFLAGADFVVSVSEGLAGVAGGVELDGVWRSGAGWCRRGRRWPASASA